MPSCYLQLCGVPNCQGAQTWAVDSTKKCGTSFRSKRYVERSNQRFEMNSICVQNPALFDTMQAPIGSRCVREVWGV